MADEFRQAGLASDLERVSKTLYQWQSHEDSVKMQKAHMEQSKALSDRDHNERVREFTEKQKQAAADRQTVLDAYTPDIIAALGQRWAVTGAMPSGLGRSGPQAAIRARIVEAGLEWAKSQGIEAAALPALQAEMNSSKQALSSVARQRSVALANVGNFERHMDNLVELGKKVERGQSPVVNRYQLMLKGQYQGDADTAVYQTQAYEVAQEFAKVMVGTAQGDANTRDEARKIINGALNQAQLEAVGKQLKINAENRIKAWDAALAEQTDLMKRLGGATVTPAPAAPVQPAPAKPAAGWSIVK